jgi:chorismate mutase/prephenate dehydratase
MKKQRTGRAGDRASARKKAVGLKPDLHSIRDSIDDIDRRIHDLLNERAKYAQQVGDSKRSEGLSTADFYKPEREAQVLRQALERNKGPLRNEEIARLFREIMSACLAQQEPLKVTFLGP